MRTLSLILILTLGVAGSAHAQQIDYTCQSRCISAGYTYGYCNSACSYGQKHTPQVVPNIPLTTTDDVPSIMERQRARDEQNKIQRQQADAQTKLLDAQTRSIELENQRREAELEQRNNSEQVPASPHELEVMNTWQAAAAQRRGLYADFDQVVFAPDVPITMSMVELMAASPYAADIAYYFGKNKHEAAQIAGMPLLDQAGAIKEIERKVQIR